ncbi:MAG: M2 family metallopeptidase, partial [Deltaproteobacteria bacterium]|nr:M2 family metallopeptidase [Deltaproteobacteria bacterium]
VSLKSTAEQVVGEFVEKYRPLDTKLREAWFRYTSTGDKKASEEQEKLELAIRTLESDPQRFTVLKELYAKRDELGDPLLKRQVELLYLGYLENQVPAEKLKKLTALEREVQETFNDYRPIVDGKKLTPVDVSHAFQDSKDAVYLEKVWKAQHLVGALVESKYRELVELRNEIARDLGFANYVELTTTTSEFNLKELHTFYRDIKKLTDKPFKKLKEKFLDPKLAAHFGISVKELRPWHYQNLFFQEVPNAAFEKVDLDRFYAGLDSQKAIDRTNEFYASMGIDSASIVKRSSLFPKEGKNPHAVAWFLSRDRTGSSLMSMNLPALPTPPKANEVSTLVHELSHDINYEAILTNPALPYLLREPTMLTEAVAMLFEHQTLTKDWFMKLGASEVDATSAASTVQLMDYVDQLIFLRWSSVIFCFETQFYADPQQDISTLWWKCKAEHQFMARPDGWKNPDALAKYHIPNGGPLQYTNYAIGRVANVQFAYLLASKINQDPRGASYFGQKDLGAWLMSDFLAQGERLAWDEFITHSTGKPLSIDDWKKFYLKSGLEKKLFQ